MKRIWELPHPSSGFTQHAEFKELPKRACCLNAEYEDDDAVTHSITFTFEGVEAYKCTYLSSCNTDMLKAYDTLVDCGTSVWLKKAASTYRPLGDDKTKELKHYMIFFDDGPCYEFICESVNCSAD